MEHVNKKSDAENAAGKSGVGMEDSSGAKEASSGSKNDSSGDREDSSSRLEECSLAERVGREMSAQDEAGRFLGIEIEELRAGYARLSMAIRREFLNGFQICHGGITFALADSAFAYACNSHNEMSVALSCNINYVVAVHEGDKLRATAQELTLSRRTGVYDIAIQNQHGVLVATFRGTSYNTKKPVWTSAQS